MPDPDPLADWSRPYYGGPGGRPFLFYIAYGDFATLPALSPERYRSSGIPPGLQLSGYDRRRHPGKGIAGDGGDVGAANDVEDHQAEARAQQPDPEQAEGSREQ